MRGWAFGFGKANREKLGAIMTYSILSMLLLAEVGGAGVCGSCGGKRLTPQMLEQVAFVLGLNMQLDTSILHLLGHCDCRAQHACTAQPVPPAVLPVVPPAVLQCFLIFYMYYIDEHMMGRKDNWQYPHMLAKHYAGRLGLSAAAVVTAAQVRGGSGQGRVPGANKGLPSLRHMQPCSACNVCVLLLLVPQWFERSLDVLGLIAGAVNVYITKVGYQKAWPGLARVPTSSLPTAPPTSAPPL